MKLSLIIFGISLVCFLASCVPTKPEEWVSTLMPVGSLIFAKTAEGKLDLQAVCIGANGCYVYDYHTAGIVRDSITIAIYGKYPAKETCSMQLKEIPFQTEMVLPAFDTIHFRFLQPEGRVLDTIFVNK